MMKSFSRIWILCSVVAVVVSGCGYTTQSTLDPAYQTIFVAAFYDNTQQYDLQAPLTTAVIRKFIHDTRLKVVREENADLRLEGVILDYDFRGITTADDEVSQFGVIVTAAVRLIDQRTGQLLWEEPRMLGETLGVTRTSAQSTDRLRGNANVFLPTVRSFASDEENQAVSEALEQLASDVFYRTVEPW